MKWMPRACFGLMAVAVVATACGDTDTRPESPLVRAEREAAYRQACAARLLAEEAEDDLQVLEETLAALDPSEPATQLGRQTTMAALGFARAYERHADLRRTAYAYMDSAVNHAATSADSARYIERAGAFSIRSPEEGTVEANVLASYQADLSAVLENANHPCNWDFPF